MTLLFVGIAVFFAIHLLPIASRSRQALVTRLGEPVYKTLFAILSAIGLVVLMIGKGGADFIPLWEPPAWSTVVSKILMLPAFVLIAALFLRNNIKRVVKHPMLLATILWAIAHLLTNGDAASILLFGSFGLYGVVDYIAISKRSIKEPPKSPILKDIIVLIIGAVIYALVYNLHPVAFDPL